MGGRFPTEQDLQIRFNLGRHTIREALKVLTEQGILGRRRKTGTVVLSRTPVSHYVHSLRDLRGLFDFAQSTSFNIQHEGFVTSFDRMPEDAIRAGDRRWFRMAGLRSTRADGLPLCWSEVLVPERFRPEREAIRRGDKAIYEIVLDEHRIKLDYVEQEISAVELPSRLAHVLSSEADTAALLVRRRYVARGHGTFEVSQNLYPSGRYSVKSVLRQRA